MVSEMETENRRQFLPHKGLEIEFFIESIPETLVFDSYTKDVPSCDVHTDVDDAQLMVKLELISILRCEETIVISFLTTLGSIHDCFSIKTALCCKIFIWQALVIICNLQNDLACCQVTGVAHK